MLSEKNRRVLKTGHPVRVLIVEDSKDDADLMVRQLRKGGFKPKSHRVESSDGLSNALKKETWDILLCDHNMPGFDSVQALRILNESEADIPFLLISDAIPNDVVTTLKEQGAKATLSKHEMGQLVPAVVKELQSSMSKKRDHNTPSSTSNHQTKNPSDNGSSISLLETKRMPEELTKNGVNTNGTGSDHSNHNGNGESKGPIKNILIVEDEMIQSILLEKLVKSLGYKVVGKVTTGADAIKMALELQPDVITMDISLQDDIDGIMATKSIQSKSMIPVIYISGNSDQYNYQRAKKTNFIDFIPKPVNKESLAKSFSKAEDLSKEKSS